MIQGLPVSIVTEKWWPAGSSYEEATPCCFQAGRPHGPRRCGGPEHSVGYLLRSAMCAAQTTLQRRRRKAIVRPRSALETVCLPKQTGLRTPRAPPYCRISSQCNSCARRRKIRARASFAVAPPWRPNQSVVDYPRVIRKTVVTLRPRSRDCVLPTSIDTARDRRAGKANRDRCQVRGRPRRWTP